MPLPIPVSAVFRRSPPVASGFIYSPLWLWIANLDEEYRTVSYDDIASNSQLYGQNEGYCSIWT